MIKRKRNILSFAVILTLFALSFLNAGYSVAAVSVSEPKDMTSEGGEISVKKDKIRYGAIIPDVNSYSAMNVDGYYQSNFTVTDWEGTLKDNEFTTDIEGKEINESYPVWFDADGGTETGSTIGAQRSNGMLDPWSDLSWVQVDTTDAENATLSEPFVFSTTRNWYCMGENTELLTKVPSGIPMQIDIKIDSKGPKILQYEFLGAAVTSDSMGLISPSGKAVNTYDYLPYLVNEIDSSVSLLHMIQLFNYYGFVACETGTYTLWVVGPSVGGTSHLSMKFVDVTPTTLSEDTLTFGGSGEDDVPNWEEVEQNEWSSEWYSFDVEAGGIYKLDLANKYTMTGGTYDMAPAVNIFTPCCTEIGYLKTTGTFGTNWIYAPEAGKVYVAIDEVAYYNINRYSMYLEQLEAVDWAINTTTETFALEGDEVKAIQWTMEEDAFVRINWTGIGDGTPELGWDPSTRTTGSVLYLDSIKDTCDHELPALETKTEGENTYYYHYLPAGDYVSTIYNNQPTKKGYLKLDSRYVTNGNKTLAPSTLGAPYQYYGLPLALTFDADVTNPALKYGQTFQLNITKPGMYRLNTSVYGSVNGLLNEFGIAKLITYDDSAIPTLAYNDSTAALAEEDFGVLTIDEVSDAFYIGASYKWSDFHINITDNPGVSNLEVEVCTGSGWQTLGTTTSPTLFTSSVSHDYADWVWRLSLHDDETHFYDSIIANWMPGADGDIDTGLTTTMEESYYWMRITCNSYSADFRIDSITLSNMTIDGDLNMVLLMEDSPYEKCDFYKEGKYSAVSTTDGFILNAIGNATLHAPAMSKDTSMATKEYDLLDTMICEPGLYTLLVIPAHWSKPGALTVHFGLEDLSGWITKSAPINVSQYGPVAHAQHIVDGKITTGFSYNYTTLDPYFIAYRINTTYTVPDGSVIGRAWFNFTGASAYNWTTLLLKMRNVTGYQVDIIHDLPWISNTGPNNERVTIYSDFLTPALNNTLEFAVMDDNFSLLITYLAADPPGLRGPDNTLVWIKLRVSQWNTPQIETVDTDLYECIPGGGLGAIPGFDMFLLIGAVMAVSAILVVKKLKSTKRV